ncbi:MAG: bifunctional adenosylcobinamide kinase/adenosylcobinamide-phosphate guanylyltransferase [Acidimicrobiales bacterium]
MLTLLTGGARSGKSSAAVRLATVSGRAVVYVATAEAGDDEMADRISRHQADRPSEWTTIDAPRALAEAVRTVDTQAAVIVDCLALWVTNLLDLADEEIHERAAALAGALRERQADTIVVTNEVGDGIVPDNAVARRFRDVLGTVNQQVRSVSDQAYLCVAGGVIPITDLTGPEAGRV